MHVTSSALTSSLFHWNANANANASFQREHRRTTRYLVWLVYNIIYFDTVCICDKLIVTGKQAPKRLGPDTY